MQKIPYGISDFEEIRKENYYFVDKTSFIRELESYRVPIFLRPPRFGKSLWCSLLECYYDINRNLSFTRLFGDLEIGKRPTNHHNSYLVLSLKLNDTDLPRDVEKLEAVFEQTMQKLFQDFLHYYQGYFQEEVKLESEKKAYRQLALILDGVKNQQLPPLYLIVDGYDKFTSRLAGSGKMQGLLDDTFLKNFYRAIKSGIENLAIARVFITGVLPVTLDSQNKGYGMAENLSLTGALHNMLGFTGEEVEQYIKDIFNSRQFSLDRLEPLLELVKNYYNGYQFSSTTKVRLYHPSLLNYFLQNLVEAGGKIPREKIDPNQHMEIFWIGRLTERDDQTHQLIENLINKGGLQYDAQTLDINFDLGRPFEPGLYAASLYYLGMLSRNGFFEMSFPNQSIKHVFADYYYHMERIVGEDRYDIYFQQFLKNGELEPLFDGYWQTFISQVPGQTFDWMKENFFQITLFELCYRYLKEHYTFAVGANYPSGQEAWEMISSPDSKGKKTRYLVLFKYYNSPEACDYRMPEQVLRKEARKINNYQRDISNTYPEYEIKKAVIYIVANRGFKFFNL